MYIIQIYKHFFVGYLSFSHTLHELYVTKVPIYSYMNKSFECQNSFFFAKYKLKIYTLRKCFLRVSTLIQNQEKFYRYITCIKKTTNYIIQYKKH